MHNLSSWYGDILSLHFNLGCSTAVALTLFYKFNRIFHLGFVNIIKTVCRILTIVSMSVLLCRRCLIALNPKMVLFIFCVVTKKDTLNSVNLSFCQSWLLPIDNDTIVPEWDWHDCSQVRVAQLLTVTRSHDGEDRTVVPKECWHGCSGVRLTWLFPSETGTIVSKWQWHQS